MHHTVPQPRLGGRAPIVPQAKGARRRRRRQRRGLYVRGQREDYGGWDALLGGGSGWSYGDLLPHFRALERNSKFNDAYHGISGGLRVSDPGGLCDTDAGLHPDRARAPASYHPDFSSAPPGQASASRSIRWGC